MGATARGAVGVVTNKYGAKRCSEDGYDFASRKELAHYRELKLRQLAGEIGGLRIHPEYPLTVNGIVIGKMTLDFEYVEARTGQTIMIDVKGGSGYKKGTKSEAYSLRKRVWEACYHPWKITEV